MLQVIFRTTLIVSIAAALLAVEFNSFNKAMAVKPVQVTSSPAASPTSPLEIAASKKVATHRSCAHAATLKF